MVFYSFLKSRLTTITIAGAVAGFVGFIVGGYFTNALRYREIQSLRNQLQECIKEKEVLQVENSKLGMCRQEMEKLKIDYQRRLQAYAEEATKLKGFISKSYEKIQPQEGAETCVNLKQMLDELVKEESEQ